MRGRSNDQRALMRKTLDPNLASILDSIRATVGGDAPPAPAVDAEPEPEERAGDEIQPDAPVAVTAAPAATPARGKKAAVPPPQRSVEEFLAELIRPQVQAWLDAHLPELIQKMAAEEIARLTGRN
jgi:cell pole-organizing protein PopZ